MRIAIYTLGIVAIGMTLWLKFKTFILFAFTMGLMLFQAATWNGGKNQPIKSIELQVPETETTLIVFAKRSHPSQPEFDRWLEVRASGTLVKKVEVIADTSGANIIDVFVQRDDANLKVFLTSPFFYRMENRLDPGGQGLYPDISDTPSTVAIEQAKEFARANPRADIDPIKMASEFPRQKFWILYRDSFTRTDKSAKSQFEELTQIGSFDTRYNTWTDALTSGTL